MLTKESRFENVGDYLIRVLFEGECKLNENDEDTLMKISYLTRKIAEKRINEQEFNKLLVYARELEKREA